MNHKHFMSIIFSVLLTLATSWAMAEELVGKPVAPGTGEPASEQVNASSVASDVVNAEHIEQFVQHKIQSELPVNSNPFKNFEADNDFNEFVLIPIVSVLVIFGGGFLFLIYLFILRNRAAAQRRSQQQEQIQRFIDAGRDVPNELLYDIDGYHSNSNLAKGIKDTLIGVAIVVFLTVLVGFDIGAAGLIIVAAGLARIIIWKLTQPKNS